MNKKTWIIFGVICVAIIGILIAVSRGQSADVSNVDGNKVLAASEASGNIADQVYGKKDAKVLLVKYGDYQCPGCAKAYPIMKAISEEYKDRIAFVYRNFPLTSSHPNAKAAAAAAEAAGLQGKFWEMHDKLFELQKSWGPQSTNQRTDTLVGYAREIGVKDLDKFKLDMASDSVAKKISFDQALGRKQKAQATPTILLNGTKIEGETWGDEAKMKAAIEEALK